MCPYYLYYLVGLLSNKDNKDTYFVVLDSFISILKDRTTVSLTITQE